MIEINLLPEELKVKIKKAEKEAKYLIYFNVIPVLFAIIIVINISLFMFGIIRGYQFNTLNKKWQRLQPQRKILENFKKGYEGLSGDDQIIRQLIKQRIDWSEKLNKLSLNLTSGIWFNEIFVSQKEFILKGSVVSLQKEELSLINKFMDNLKNDAGFMDRFNNLDLTSVQRRTVAGYDVVDFILTAAFKAQ